MKPLLRRRRLSRRHLNAGVQATRQFAGCRNKTGIKSLVTDLVELKGLLSNPGAPTGGAVQDVTTLADSMKAYRDSGWNVVIMPHSEGNVITREAILFLQKNQVLRANGTPTCLAVAPMASPTTSYGPLDSRYIHPVQLAGDVVLTVPVSAGASSFPPSESSLNNELTEIRSRLYSDVEWKAREFLDAMQIHGMTSYLDQNGGLQLVMEAGRAAYYSCAISRIDIAYAAPNAMLVGSQKQFTAYPFNGAQDPIANRPLAWTASGGITISASGLATATGNAGLPGYLASGPVEAHAGWFSASEGVQVTSTPPEITASSCTKGAVTYEGAWRYTHFAVLDSIHMPCR